MLEMSKTKFISIYVYSFQSIIIQVCKNNQIKWELKDWNLLVSIILWETHLFLVLSLICFVQVEVIVDK